MAARQIVKSYDDVITFGKFKGQTFDKIADVEPSYIVWLNDEGIVKFPKEIIEAAEWDMNVDTRNEWGDSWGWDGDVQD
jgi:hypothetical protein